MQDLIDGKEMEFSGNREHSINVITSTTYSGKFLSSGAKPITIFHDNRPMKEETSETPKPVLVIEVLKPFPYTLNKTVPWDYRCNYANETTATDLIGIGGITCSGRIYLPTITNQVAPERSVISIEKEQPP